MRNREFRGLIAAQITSECGDQIAAIALSYLVYTRSNSPFLAAATYAVRFIPWVFGSILLAPLIDRFRRRRVMLVCDLARAVLIGVLSLIVSMHGISIGLLISIVFVSSVFTPAFSVARGAMLPDIFEGGTGYVTAVAIGRILQQVDQVFGFALGGAVVAVVSPRGALAIDSATFVASFLITALEVRERPGAAEGLAPTVRSLISEVRPTLALVLASRVRGSLLLLASTALVFLVAPEGLSIAYARQHGHGAVAAGLLMASEPFGIAVGSWLFIKYVPPRQQGRMLLPLATGGAGVLAVAALVPPIWLACVIWMLAGVSECFLVTTIAAYNITTERPLRGRANGVASAAISLAQGLGFLAWGAVGSWRGAAAGVAWAGVAGLLLVALVRFSWPDDEIAAAWDDLEVARQNA
jgi:MFS family permease